jgi:hypothetical protein
MRSSLFFTSILNGRRKEMVVSMEQKLEALETLGKENNTQKVAAEYGVGRVAVR